MSTFLPRFRWWLIAAAVVLVGGASLVCYRIFFPARSPNITPGAWPCKLKYDMGWNSLSCASFRVRLESGRYNGEKSVRMSFSGRTLPVIDWAWSYRTNGLTYALPGSMLPRFSRRRVKTPDEQKEVYTRFDRSRGALHTLSIESGDEDEDNEKMTAPCRPGLDIQGAFLYLGHLDWEDGRTRTLEVVDEDERYKLTASAMGTERVSVKAGTFKTVKLDVSLRDTEKENEDEKSASEKYRTIHVWISQRCPRVPVKMRSQVFVGSVTAELTALSCREASRGAENR